MTNASDDEKEGRKRAIFDGMSPRRQQHILKKGYKKWDPFIEPKDPIDIRKDTTRRTTQQLAREFLQSRPLDESYSNAYGAGVLEICMGIVNDDDKYKAMFDFSVWYDALLKKEGHV